jgi:hypothetical protein
MKAPPVYDGRRSISHFRRQIARHFHANANFANYRGRPCHGVVSFFVSQAQFRLEPRAKYKLPRRPNNRQTVVFHSNRRFLMNATRAEESAQQPLSAEPSYPREQPFSVHANMPMAPRRPATASERLTKRSRGAGSTDQAWLGRREQEEGAICGPLRGSLDGQRQHLAVA